jgi:hypothetical protein
LVDKLCEIWRLDTSPVTAAEELSEILD